VTEALTGLAKPLEHHPLLTAVTTFCQRFQAIGTHTRQCLHECRLPVIHPTSLLPLHAQLLNSNNNSATRTPNHPSQRTCHLCTFVHL